MVSVIFVTITLCLSANSVLAQQQLPVFCNLVDCRDPVCPGGALPVIPPGQCCKVCSGPPNCAVVSCLARDCPGAFVPPGQCCPQCPVDCSLVDCLQDPVCPGGARSFIPPGQCCGVCPDPPNCAAVLCLARDCRGAFVPPGQCCQVCPDCSMVRCASVLDCPGGAPSFVPPGECCAQCPVDPCASFPCLNGGSCHELGNTFTCECELGFRGRYCEIGSQGKCPAPGIGICVEECTSDTDCAGNQKCCSNGCGHVCTDPVVSGCSWKGQTYAEGSQFMDDCNQCFCRSGVVGCTRKGCPVGGCVHNNTWYPNEASFKDDCNTCICNMGSVACTEMACVGCVHNGVTHPVGSTFKVDCNTCTCRSNGFPICTLIACMDCRLVRCAAPTCRHPVTPPGACCGVCDQGCDFEGALYNEGERVPCVERCGPCVCLGGTVQEQRRPCPPPRCPNPVTPSGACCPVCEQGCDFEGVWYNEGERVPCVERCGPCVCLGGRVTEQRRPCPHPPCPNPVTPPGACCPVCEQGCDFEGVWYNEGERVPCIERCGPCVCLGGRVTEQRRPCLPPRCPNPVTPPGACCPVCRGRGRRVGWGSNPGRGSGRGRQGRQVVQGDNPGEYH